MSQREVACKEGASPAFRTNNIADDKCHANSGAVDRRDGADKDDKENACDYDDNDNDENRAKDCHDDDADKAASATDDAASASLAKGSGVVGKDILPLI